MRVTIKIGWNSICELKPKQEWDRLDNKGSKANAWALYNIFTETFS